MNGPEYEKKIFKQIRKWGEVVTDSKEFDLLVRLDLTLMKHRAERIREEEVQKKVDDLQKEVERLQRVANRETGNADRSLERETNLQTALRQIGKMIHPLVLDPHDPLWHIEEIVNKALGEEEET